MDLLLHHAFVHTITATNLLLTLPKRILALEPTFFCVPVVAAACTTLFLSKRWQVSQICNLNNGQENISTYPFLVHLPQLVTCLFCIHKDSLYSARQRKLSIWSPKHRLQENSCFLSDIHAFLLHKMRAVSPDNAQAPPWAYKQLPFSEVSA